MRTLKRLKASSESAYCAHVCSCLGSTPHSRSSRRSTGPSTLGKGCVGPSKTWKRYLPSGCVTASTSAKNNIICNQPRSVMAGLEALWPEQRVDEVDGEQHRERG